MAKRAAKIGKVALGIVGVLVVFFVIGVSVEKEEAEDRTAAVEIPTAEQTNAASADPAQRIQAPAMTTAPAPQPTPSPQAPKAAPATAAPRPISTTRRSHEADRYTSFCIQPDEIEACEADKDRIRDLYDKAYGGDYQAQRNLAYSLSDRSAAVVRSPLNACTWRLIIVSSGAKQVDDSDWANMNLICSRLSELELAQAKAQAIALTTRMTMGDPIDDETIDMTGLDGTAERLIPE